MSISEVAENIGFHTIRTKLSWLQLRDQADLPCIVHWNQNHFIVVYRIAKKHGKWFVYVSDPAIGLLKYTSEQYLKSWLEIKGEDGELDRGIALILNPTPALHNKTQETTNTRYNLRNLLLYLKPHMQSILQVLLAMLVACVLNLLLPIITQLVVDQGVTLGKLNFVKTMLLAQLLIVIGQLANDLIRNWIMLHMTARVSIALISDFLAKLMRLPISFFDKKMTGDIMQRILDHGRIQDFLTNSLLSIFMSTLLIIIYGSILGGYSIQILFIFLLGSIFYIGWVLIFLKWRRKLDYLRFQEAANNQSNMVQLINGMQDIKLNNSERQKRWEWERIQAKLFNIRIRGLTLSQTQQIGSVFIDQTKNILISFFAAKSVIEGDITLGMMTAISYIIGQLNTPVSQFVSFVRESQDARISMERLGEIHNREEEEPADIEKIQNIPDDAGLEFNNVSFQYDGPNSPKVLESLSCSIPRGSITAIVGDSGSGKTTMMKMMLGFYQPVEGTILLGHNELNRYSNREWRKHCGCVMQEGFVFSNSIAENIALCDETPDMARVRNAAAIANINEWIEHLPLGYNTRIGTDGHGISIGQKQRILIARAVYKNSPFFFFDEATNSLDANNEKAIIENLRSLFKGKTVVIIAHRLSTVRNADNIIVLREGHIVEQGNHDFLTKRKGYYYELVRNQLELGH